MSYYPTSDQDRLQSIDIQDGGFARTPPDSTGPHEPNDDWTSSSTSDNLLHHTSHAFSWPDQEPRGLGLLPLPTTVSDQVYQDALAAAESSSMPFAWPSEFITSPQPAATSFERPRKDSYVDSCNPQSTLLPDTSWQPFSQESSSSTMIYAASPSLSSYSTSSRRSAMSSPYPRSEGYERTARSPMVKLEEAQERATPRIHVLSETAPLGQSMLVNPSDLVNITQPSYTLGKRVATLLQPSFSSPSDDPVDAKAFSRPHRTAYRRAFSAEDVHEELLEDRQKRGFTKPENANCHCDQCGKLFQRSYNLKAHMETHDPNRNQPHFCQHPACDKRFVRRTDLLRHEQSVHLKERNYPCPLCNSSFARKDTLRRHVDDGCPRRPEVKKRVTKVRRPSNAASASGTRRPSTQHNRDPTPAPSPLRQPAQFP